MKKKIKADRPVDFDFVNLHQKLIRWYRHHGRDLPWRRTRDPYRIWVSEIMLQQTQVSSVIPYYERFLAEFPSVDSLAKAHLEKVLKLWEGAGYYARARNLHKAAQVVVKELSGKIPSDPDLLEKLPGIGRSTAGAISSLAYGLRAPILDGNVRRVLCRLFGIQQDPRKPAVDRQLWGLSEACLPNRNVDHFNQAMMDLGAIICVPVKPSCLLCPIREVCGAFRLGIQTKIPVKMQRPPLPERQISVAVIFKKDRLLIGQRPMQGLLGGLWGLPELKRMDEDPQGKKICETFKNRTGLTLEAVKALAPVIHTFTHFKMTFYPMLYRCRGGRLREDQSWVWTDRMSLSSYPISVATRKILNQVLEPKLNRPVPGNIPLAAERTAPYGLYHP
jgi:A/G-specific adenine glycosylase